MSEPDANSLATALSGRQQGDGWIARCPAHDDRTASLSIHARDGQVLVYCHAGCSQDAVLGALRRRGLWQLSSSSSEGPRIVAEYDYRDEGGNLLFQVVRYSPKDFRTRRPDAGGFAWNLRGVRRVLYRLPELLAKPAAPVFIVEGEKDADALANIGLLSTTNQGGAGKWRPDYTQTLRNRNVRIVPDHDEAGAKHAERVAKDLAQVAKTVRIVPLPDLARGGDVSEWLAGGGTAKELERLAAASEPIRWEPRIAPESDAVEGEQEHRGPGVFADQLQRERIRFIWPGRLAFGKTHLLVGDPEQMKTTWAVRIAADLSQGRPLPGGDQDRQPPMASVIFTWEDGAADTIVGRLMAAGADLERILIVEEDLPTIPDDLSAIERAVTKTKARTGVDVGLVVIDPLAAALAGGVDSRNNSSTRRALSPLKILAQRLDVAILLIDHLNKNASQAAIHRATGSIAFMAAARVALLVGPDPMDTEPDPAKRRRALVRLKGNIGSPPPALLYRRTSVAMSEDPSDTEVTLEVTGEAAISPDQVLGNLASKAERRGATDPSADDFLIDILAKGPRPIEIVREAATKAGLTKSTLDRAKRALEVVTKKRDDGTYFWSLRDDTQRVTDEVLKAKHCRRAEERLATLDVAVARLEKAIASGPMIKEAAISSLMSWGAPRAMARQAVEWERRRWHLERAGRIGGGSLLRPGPQHECGHCRPPREGDESRCGPSADDADSEPDRAMPATDPKFADSHRPPASGLNAESANLNGRSRSPEKVGANGESEASELALTDEVVQGKAAKSGTRNPVGSMQPRSDEEREP